MEYLPCSTTTRSLNRIEIRANIGVSMLSTEEPFVSTGKRLSYWFGPAIATVGVVRGLSETFSGTLNQGVVETTGVTVRLPTSFTPSLRGLAGVSYYENDFTGRRRDSRNRHEHPADREGAEGFDRP